MKFVVISDTHNKHCKLNLPKGDVLVHCGDYSNFGNIVELSIFSEWLKNQDYKYKIVVAGNHDKILQENPVFARKNLILDSNIFYLQDSYCEIEGLKIYGAPWVNKIGKWAWGLSQEEKKKAWEKIPNDIDILVTHSPPYGIQDKGDRLYDESYGCFELLSKVIDIKPRYHLFGHVHEARGITKKKGTVFINASSVGSDHRTIENPFTFEISKKIEEK